MKPDCSLEDFKSGKVVIDPGWLIEVWNKWPRDETVEELLASLNDHEGGQ